MVSAVGFQGADRSLELCQGRPWVGSRTVARSCRHPARSGSTEVCPAQSRPALLGSLPATASRWSHARSDRGRPHKHSHTAAAVDQRGERLAQQRFPASREGHRALRRFGKRWRQRRWAIEGAAGVGRILAQQLVANGEEVIDVPAKLAARVRELSVGHGAKTTPATRSRSRWPPWAASACTRSASRTTPRCCGCCLVAPGAANQPTSQGPPAAGRGPGPRHPRPRPAHRPGPGAHAGGRPGVQHHSGRTVRRRPGAGRQTTPCT